MNDTPIPPKKIKSFDLDEVELHGDIQVGRASSKEEPLEPHRSFKSWIWLFVVLTIALGSILGFFLVKYQELKDDYASLQDTKGETQANLSATESSLQEIHEQLEQSRKEAKELRREIDQRKGDAKKLRATNDSLQKKVAAGKKELSKEKKRAVAAEKEAKNAVEQSAKIDNDFQNFRDANAEKITDLLGQLDQNVKTTKELQAEHSNGQELLTQLSQELERLKKQLEEEGAASMRLIQERSQLRESNAQLNRQRNQLQQSLDEARTKIQNLEGVHTGKLVPFSSKISPAIPSYQEPLPKELKISKRQGPLVIQMLINEVGAVEKAFVVPGQLVDREAARAIIDHVKKWKFTPPTLDGVRVKTWQPILVHTK